MSHKTLTLTERINDLDDYSHNALRQFPRLERHILCAEIRITISEIVKMTVRAWKVRSRKTPALFELDIEIEALRHKIRKSHRLRYINERTLGIWMGHVNSVGASVGEWIKKELVKEADIARNKKQQRLSSKA